ncbi:KpsF/GutQ family sugar-phosphate isomerase [Lutibaculum baratangense]|nr:KpsF/GutQ family sugar-phosphate isomerase [Lutibaculum baratangense]
MSEPILKNAHAALDITIEGIDALKTSLHEGPLAAAFVRAIRLLQDLKGRLIISGVGKSGHIGRKLAATFSSTGTPAHFVHPTEASHGDLGMIGAEDALLALSWSGETSEFANMIEYTQRFGVPLVAITAGENSTLARAARVALVLPQIREACPHNLAPTTSTVLQLALGDALAVTLLAEKGFRPDDFRIFHPGGKLGARLRYIHQFMHAGPELPLQPLGTPMSDALIKMTEHGFGTLGIVDPETGELKGIITDGDLRRHMSPHLLSQKVEEVMTRNPITARPDDIASSALQLLETHRITVIFVVENGRPIGVVRFLDLLRGGIA